MNLTIGMDASVVASSSGGTRTYALGLLTNLVELRKDWRFVLYLRHHDDAVHLGGLAQASNVRMDVVRGRPNAWRVQALLPGRLRRDRVDLYHSLGQFLPLRWHGPEVVTIHDLNIYVNTRNWLRGPTLLPWMDLAAQTWLAVRRADHIITVSESSRQQVRRIMHVSDNRITVTPLAADPFFTVAPPSEEVAAAQALAGGRPFILFVGILSPQKNLPALVKAFAQSGLATEGIRLVLAGSDRERYGDAVRQVADDAGVGEAVVTPGYVSQSMLRALLHAAVCLVLPSHGEGFGLPLVEAMACGTPVVAADRQAIPEVLGGAGCLFDPDDVAALATLLTRVAQDAAFRSELAGRSLARARDFSWRRTAELTAAVYESVVASKRR